MTITRRHLQVSLAVLWLIDGLLQCQPFMFSRSFATQVLAPAGLGQPHVIAWVVHSASAIVAAHPALTNSAFAAIQLALGVGLFNRRFPRVALAASAVWGLSVWFVGEGLGGIAGGGTLLTGAPGAALLYAAIACLAWPTRVADADQRPSRLAVPAWGALWVGAAILQFVAGNDASSSLSATVQSASSNVPQWIGNIDRHLAHVHLPTWTAAAIVALNLLIAMWVMVPGWARGVSVVVGTVVVLVGWVLIQGAGDLTSGQATDPSIGPLVVLLASAALSAAPLSERSRNRSRALGRVPAPLALGVASIPTAF